MVIVKYEGLYENCQKSLQDFIDFWGKMVNIDCGSRYGSGINQVVYLLAEKFQKLDPQEMQIIPMENPAEGSHLLVTFKGKGKGRILAGAHLDTVFPKGTAAQRPFRIEGDWVKGPGCADCKSGVTMLLFAMKQLRKINFTDFDTITFLFNGDEEIGSYDSRKILQKLAPGYDCFLCCESGQEGDGIVQARKGSNRLKLEVHGMASHAGSAPDKGHSALMEILCQIPRIKELERPEIGTTINFTLINGGTADNIIPDYVCAVADVRIARLEEVNRIRNGLEKISAQPQTPGTAVKAKLLDGTPPFFLNEGTDRLVFLAQNIYAELGKKLKVVRAGGASDANWAAFSGLIAIDGFGAVKGGKNHTPQECVSLSSVVPRMYLLSRMFMELGSGIPEKG
ncbi:M20 family metallopeptidase [Acidaminococcus massiliensis]|uniref:M20 family metallopeptidase n=1 Tax=Acidaminococcus massiliensis TaxID=1852375 RepID=UPI001E63FECE|nr:M20 family metallopeptidase [Acidaminococcus massiliensis]